MVQHKLIIGIIGPAGSGKGTQAPLIVKTFNLKHILIGDAIKAEIRNKTALGQKLEGLMKRGEQAPTGDIVNILQKQLEGLENYSGVLIDSGPLNMEQVEAFEKFIPLDCLVYMEVADFAALKVRLSKRRVCPSCNMPTDIDAAANGLCKACGTKLIQRIDDMPETIDNRFRVFEKRVLPVVNYYIKEDKCIAINASNPISAVSEEVLLKMRAFFSNRDL